MEQKYFTVKDLQARYRLSRTSIYEHMKAGRLPQGVKIGHSRRFSIDEIKNSEKHFQTA